MAGLAVRVWASHPNPHPPAPETAMSSSHEPRPIAAAELLPLAIAAENVDNGSTPVGAPIGTCPSCDTDVVSGESYEPLHTLDLYWVAKPCGCLFSVSDETLAALRQGLGVRLDTEAGPRA